jgi:hypothetical protein
MKNIICSIAALLFAMSAIASPAAEPQLKIGIIGLDTSHVLAFTKDLNSENPPPELAGCRVVVAYPRGSRDIESSTTRVPKYTEDIKKMGVEIVDSIDELVKRVDCVLLESNDGRVHLEQAIPCFKAGKPTFIDKPIAASLADAIAIFEAAKKYNCPTFSSSSLRYGKNTQAVHNGSIGKVTKAETTSPASLEKTHPDLYWYGIHGVESLFTVMGTGCEMATRKKRDDGKIETVGEWVGGRVGTYREDKGYAGKAIGEKGEAAIGESNGYRPLIVEIVKFFKTKQPPVSEKETLEICAFIEADFESKRRGGEPVELEEMIVKARPLAENRLAELGVK